MLIKEKKIWTPDNSFLLEYHARIEVGEIVVGQELWQELENLKADFANDLFFYNTNDALLRMDFMEKCVRLTKSPFYNKPMVLMLWQKAFIESIYAFKMSETTFRRFKKILLLIGRKNTKSETTSAIALGEFELGNEGADICCSSNDDAQAAIVYDAIDTMRQLVDPDDLDTKRNQRYILNKITNTKIFKMSDRTRNKEGRNIDVFILDESHEMKENTIAKSGEQSQSLKDEPLFFNLSTQGFVEDGYLDKELEKGRRIINGEADDLASIRFLPWLYTQDSEKEVWTGNRQNKLWMKSNPTLGIVKKWEYLEEQVDTARESKSDRVFVLSKDFNIKQNNAQAWLMMEDYTYISKYELEELKGSFCIGAVDLSETTDLTNLKILMMKKGDSTKYVHSMYFIPESKLEKSDDKNAGAKYKEWIEEGLMKVCEGSDNDLGEVADYFYWLYEEYDIRLFKCGYDQRYSKQWINGMEKYGWSKDNEDLVLILQNAQTLSNSMKLVEQDLKHKLINYNENEVDSWCFKNAAIKVDQYGQCLCVKQSAAMRIDGTVTLIILYEMYRRFKTEFTSIL